MDKTESSITINTFYKNKELLEKIKEQFNEQGSVQLQQCISEEQYQHITKEISALEFTHETNPLTHSYAKASPSKQLTSLFTSEQFLEFIRTISNQKNLKTPSIQIIKSKHRDYSILNDEQESFEGLEIIFDLTQDWPTSAGGAIIYTDTEKFSLQIQPLPNTITIIKRTKPLKRFFEYINHYAQDQEHLFLLIKITFS